MPATLKGHVLAIDPSTTIAGIALGKAGEPLGPKTLRESRFIMVGGIGDYVQRTRDLVHTIDAWHHHQPYLITEVVIENPQSWHSPRGTRASTSGAIAKLSFAVGALWQWAVGRDWKTTLVDVADWKGQLPKEIVLHRLQRKGLCLGLKGTATELNESDAVGLLDWYLSRR